jgi:hypothetical protein
MNPDDHTIPGLAPDALFKAAQRPNAWLDSAKRLSAAAELILKDQVSQEVPYFRAYEEATHKALAIACTAPDRAGHAAIECDPPNYLPGQLLYAFAMENVLKGLAVAKVPELVGELKLDRQIKSHDLIRLAKRASFEVAVQEVPVLEALSQIAEWAGRYPVAASLDRYPCVYRELHPY